MFTIYKYEIEPRENEPNIIMMPAGASIASAGVDGMGALCIWALVDTTAKKEERRLWCMGTGWDFSELITPEDSRKDLRGRQLNFIGTVRQGFYMWHVLEEIL